MSTAPIASLSQALHIGSTPPSADGYVMFLYGFLSMVLVIAGHGFVLLSISLALMRSQKQLHVDNPLRFKLVFTGLILVLLALHMLAIHLWAVFLWLIGYYQSFLAAFYSAGLAYTELGAFGEGRHEQWQQILPFMIAFSGLFSVGLSGSMLFALLMSAVPRPRPPRSEADAI